MTYKIEGNLRKFLESVDFPFEALSFLRKCLAPQLPESYITEEAFKVALAVDLERKRKLDLNRKREKAPGNFRPTSGKKKLTSGKKKATSGI
jgi:hypothetical protein